MTITNLVAATLSEAAYTPIADYRGASPTLTATEYLDGNGNIQSLPSGWSVDTNTTRSQAPTASDQFITFFNSASKQVVIAFKGSDSYSNFANDLISDGAGDENADRRPVGQSCGRHGRDRRN